jgi:hypothetical protein
MGILMSKRATNLLIRQLELAGPGKKIDDAAKQSYVKLFQGPLTPKSITAIRTATRLADDQITRASMAMAVDKITTQAKAATA